MTLLRDYDGRDLTGWLAMEKFHGCRAFWDGRAMWTRGGCRVALPAWLLAELPAGIALDGELWCGRGRGAFTRARMAVQFGRFPRSIRFMVFDAPGMRGAWALRMDAVREFCTNLHYVMPGHAVVLRSTAHARTLFRGVKAAGGEGLVVRNPLTMGYRVGRCWSALRIKKASQFSASRRDGCALVDVAVGCLQELLAA